MRSPPFTRPGVTLSQKNIPIDAKFFFFKNFLMWAIFKKSVLNLLQYCFCFVLIFFGCEAYGILAPSPGIEPSAPALEGKILTTGLPGMY